MEKAAPVAVLYLQHPSTVVSSAAHSLICALVQAVAPQQRGRLATAYLERALPGYPATCPSASLAVGIDTLAHALPAGNSHAAAMAARLAERVTLLVQQPSANEVRCFVHTQRFRDCRIKSNGPVRIFFDTTLFERALVLTLLSPCRLCWS